MKEGLPAIADRELVCLVQTISFQLPVLQKPSREPRDPGGFPWALSTCILGCTLV